MQQPATGAEGRPLVGILFVILATLTFAVSDVVTKHLTGLYPVPVVMAVRYLVNLALLVAFFLPREGRRLWQAQRVGLVLLRGVCLAAASLTMGWALKLMPVAETVAIIYLTPFAVMLLASPILGEKVSTVGWAGAAFGFVGVLLIVRPGGNLDQMGVVFALTNASLSTGYHLLTRLLSHTETTSSLLFHTAWVGAVVFVALAIPELPGLAPSLADLGLMALLGLLMAVGHFLFTAAYREAPASLLSPINYLHLVWAAGLGLLVFGQLPPLLSLVGIAMVTSAGVAVALHAHLQHRRITAAAAAASMAAQ